MANTIDSDVLRSRRPVQYALPQNSPNPFNSHTTIDYALPQRSQVVLSIIDGLGCDVKTLVDGVIEAGWQKAEWHGDDDSGGLAPAGTYFLRMVATSLAGRETLILHRRVTLTR